MLKHYLMSLRPISFKIWLKEISLWSEEQRKREERQTKNPSTQRKTEKKYDKKQKNERRGAGCSGGHYSGKIS